MLLLLLTLTACCALAWLWRSWRGVRQFWAQRGVPHLPPHPIYGSLTFLLRQNPYEWFRFYYIKIRHPYVGIWLFWRPGLLVNSPELARRILVTDFNAFQDRYMNSGKADPIGSLSLLVVKNPVWQAIRRQISPVFTSAKLRSFQSVYSTKAQELVQRITNNLNLNQAIDLRTTYSDYTTDIIGISTFSVDSNVTLTGKGPIKDITKDFMEFNIFRGLAWCSIYFLPKVAEFFGCTLLPQSSANDLRKIMKVAAQQRSENENEHGNDILTALLHMKPDPGAGLDINEDILVSQAAVLLEGGFDTTGLSLSHATYELAFAPDVQEKLFMELDKARRISGTGKFDYNTLSQMTYLDCVINETLRKHPVMGWLDRVTKEIYKIDENLTIPAGTPVYINSIGMQYDPKYFPDPEKFNPDRFLPQNSHNIQSYTYMPFGEGPRHCIGRRFAYQSMRFALSYVVLNFELRPLPNSPRPLEYPLETKGIFLAPKNVLSVEFILRNK